MNRTALILAGAVFALTFTGCDEKKKEEVAVPVAQPVVPAAAPAAPAEPARAEPHAARPARPAEEKDKEKKEGQTPEVGAPKTVEAPGDLKDKQAKGLDEKPVEACIGNKMPPAPLPQADLPAAEGAAAKGDVAVGNRPGRALPAALAAPAAPAPKDGGK